MIQNIVACDSNDADPLITGVKRVAYLIKPLPSTKDTNFILNLFLFILPHFHQTKISPAIDIFKIKDCFFRQIDIKLIISRNGVSLTAHSTAEQ